MQISKTEEQFTQKRPGRKPQKRVSERTTNLATYNSLSESDSEESIYDYEADEPSTSKLNINKNTKIKLRIWTSESSKQAQK